MILRTLGISLLTTENNRPARFSQNQRTSPSSSLVRDRFVSRAYQFGNNPPTDDNTHFTFNTLNNPGLLNRQGQYQAIGQALAHLEKQADPLPATCQVLIVLPDHPAEQALIQFISKSNQVIQSQGIGNTVKHQLFRSLIGIQGKMHPIAIQQEKVTATSNGSEARKIQLTLNLSDLSREDVVKIASFINKKNENRIE
jgi:hypothetical protein